MQQEQRTQSALDMEDFHLLFLVPRHRYFLLNLAVTQSTLVPGAKGSTAVASVNPQRTCFASYIPIVLLLNSNVQCNASPGAQKRKGFRLCVVMGVSILTTCLIASSSTLHG